MKALLGFWSYVLADQADDDKAGCHKALAHIDEALERGVNSFYLDERGDRLRCLGRYDEALTEYNRALALTPQRVSVLHGRAKLYGMLDDDDSKLADLDLIIALDRMDWWALRGRGIIYKKRGDLDRAERDLTDALAHGASDAVLQRWLGYTLAAQKRYDRAIEHLKTAIELDPEDAQTIYKLATVQYKVNDCGFVDTAATYLRMCAVGARCDQRFRDWAGEAPQRAIKRGICPPGEGGGRDAGSRPASGPRRGRILH